MSANESKIVVENPQTESENESPEFKAALLIAQAINSFAFETELGREENGRHTADFATLVDMSLREMLEAVAVVEARNKAAEAVEGTTTIYFVPDDRLTAAVYTFMHFYPQFPSDSGDETIVRVVQDEALDGFNLGFLIRANRWVSKSKYFGEDEEQENG